MTSERQIVAEHDGPICVIRINNPKQRNALNVEMLEQLALAVESVSLNQETSVIVITGTDQMFASGAAINELRELVRSSALDFARRGQRAFQYIADAKQLTMAAINGHCIGGGLDLALACDLRFASATATFRHPGATLGIITGWGGTQRLPRLIGEAKTLELFATARTISSREAREIGLVTRVVDPVLDAAVLFAQEFVNRRSTAGAVE
ncbi:MAG: enoyl-CoA hydratase [Blastocatellia bacterium]|jgi:enoyl-CoA hydratase|nr:enoyl-CoA hydratase [Blastocatellia bacterium]